MSGSHTLKQSSIARVFVKNHRYYGCLYASGQLHRLPVHHPNDRVTHFTLAGHFVAYVDRICSNSDTGRLCGVSVYVIDVSNGSRTHIDHREPGYAEGDTYGYADRVILASDGAIGWSYDETGGISSPRPEIRKSDSEGERRILDNVRANDAGSSFPDAHSLYLGSDGNIHWIRHVCDYTTPPYACTDVLKSAPLH